MHQRPDAALGGNLQSDAGLFAALEEAAQREANGSGRGLPTGVEDGTPFRSMGITSTAKWSFTAKSTAWILFPICVVLYIVMQFELVS